MTILTRKTATSEPQLSAASPCQNRDIRQIGVWPLLGLWVLFVCLNPESAIISDIRLASKSAGDVFESGGVENILVGKADGPQMIPTMIRSDKRIWYSRIIIPILSLYAHLIPVILLTLILLERFNVWCPEVAPCEPSWQFSRETWQRLQHHTFAWLSYFDKRRLLSSFRVVFAGK